MSKHDEEVARGGARSSALLGALSAPLTAGSLSTALRAVRGYQMLHPRDPDVESVVTVLNRMMSEVRSAARSEDPRWREASKRLEAADLVGARACYAGLATGDEGSRAAGLVSDIDLILSLLERGELPAQAASGGEPSSSVAFDCGGGSSPVVGSEEDTLDVEPVIPPEAYRDDPALVPDATGGLFGRFDTSQPPPSIPLPRVDELDLEPNHVPPESGKDRSAHWDVREPGRSPTAEEESALRGAADSSWSGVRLYESDQATFEPGVEGMDADFWEDSLGPTSLDSEHTAAERTAAERVAAEKMAEELVARGELSEALRIYQELAAGSPQEQRLWARVAEIARMLQER